MAHSAGPEQRAWAYTDRREAARGEVQTVAQNVRRRLLRLPGAAAGVALRDWQGWQDWQRQRGDPRGSWLR
ncbi:hypothetical protein P7K49_002922 [Saguinus oedipus]|uniref:Uncharacterized protein n=1 Tax=Saguinus oedipus TaxID=9490 RepID=A0ABQ9WJN7_SAGOE|nr:hypothetical protein P7K49_002922 [Saguinus oedipus]